MSMRYGEGHYGEGRYGGPELPEDTPKETREIVENI